jgi:Ca2+-transporting ATPase
MVLLDDNFTTIVDTVKDGRRIYDNIKKAVGYVFVIHIPIALIALLSPMLGIPPLLFPIHIVLLELIIDPTCSIIFERQPAEPDIMDRLPRGAGEPLVTKKLMLKTVLQGLAIFGATFGSYVYLLNFVDHSGEMARSFALIVLIISNLFLVFVNQSEKVLTLRGMIKGQDRVTWLVNTGIMLALAAIIYLPFGNTIAKTAPLELAPLLSAIGIAGIATLWWELVKVFKEWGSNAIRLDES